MNDRKWLWNAFALGGLAALWAVALHAFMTVHGPIVTGISASGTLRYGDRFSLFVLPSAAFGIFIMTMFLEKAPTSLYSLPIRIDEENETQVRAWMGWFAVYLRTVMILGFACLEVTMLSGSATAMEVCTGCVLAATFFTIALQLATLQKLR